MSASRCQYCGQPIDWHRTPRGKWQPLDVEPTTNTTVAVGQPGSVVVRDGIAVSLPPGRSVEPGEVLRIPHAASCPVRGHEARARPTRVDLEHERLDREAEAAVERDTERGARRKQAAGATLRRHAGLLRQSADALELLADTVGGEL